MPLPFNAFEATYSGADQSGPPVDPAAETIIGQPDGSEATQITQFDSSQQAAPNFSPTADLVLEDDSFTTPFEAEGAGDEEPLEVPPAQVAAPAPIFQAPQAQAPQQEIDPLRAMAALMLQERAEAQRIASQPPPPEPTLAQRFHSDQEFRAQYMHEVSGGKWNPADVKDVIQAMQLIGLNEMAEREQARDRQVQEFIAEQRAEKARATVDNSIQQTLAGYALPDNLRQLFSQTAHGLVQQGVAPEQAIQTAIAPFMSILPKRGTQNAQPPRQAQPLQPARSPRDLAAARAVATRGGNNPAIRGPQTKADIERVIQAKTGYQGWGS